VQEVLAQNGKTVVLQPPYSPDLAPWGFLFYPKLKLALWGTKFDDIDTISTQSPATLAQFKTQDLCKYFQ
jgi:hypothetical protein